MQAFVTALARWIYQTVLYLSVIALHTTLPAFMHRPQAGETNEEYYARGVRKLALIVVGLGVVLLVIATLVGTGGAKNWLAFVALLLMLPYTLFFWASTAIPVAAFDVTWDLRPDRSREYLRALGVLMTAEIAYALGIMIVPLANQRWLIPVFLTSVLLMAWGQVYKQRWARNFGAGVFFITLILFFIPTRFLKATMGVFDRGADTVTNTVNCINNPECVTETALAENIDAQAKKRIQGQVKRAPNFEGLVLLWCEEVSGSMEREFIEGVMSNMNLNPDQSVTVALIRAHRESEVCEETSLPSASATPTPTTHTPTAISSSASLTRSKEMVQWQINTTTFSKGVIEARMKEADEVGFSVVEREDEEVFFDLRINGQQDLYWECIEHLPKKIEGAYTWEVRLADSARTPGCSQSLPTGTLRIAQLYWK